jgi:tetratricopeptide (TPR) repeat protein
MRSCESPFRQFVALFLVFVVPSSVFASSQTEKATSSTGSVSEPPVILSEALQLYRTGRFEDAIVKYQMALQQDPKSGEAYAGLSRCLLKQQKIAEAFDAAGRGVSASPDSPAAHSALGEVLFRKGDLHEADVEWVKAANALKPDPRAFLGISRIEDAMSLFGKAKKSIDHAHELDPKDPEIRRNWLSTLRRSDQIRELQQYLEQATNDDAKTHDWLEHRLELLKARQEQPSRGCKLTSNLQHSEARLERLLIDPMHLHGYGLRVQVNGQSARLLLDTGASGLLINKKMAEKAGVKPIIQTKMEGIGDKGPMNGYVGYADSIKVGGLEFQNCLVEVSEKRSIVEDDGLVGADVFSHFLVTIDFPNEKLLLSELPKRPDEQQPKAVTLDTGDPDDPSTGPEDREAEQSSKPAASSEAAASKPAAQNAGPKDRYVAPEMQSYTPIFRFGHALLIPTKIGNTVPKLFLIDTGAVTNLISPAAAAEVTKVRGNSPIQIRGISGAVKDVRSADKVMIQFGHFRQENDDLISFDLSSISRGTGTEVSGILGFVMLRLLAVKIDYRDGLVDFDYKPNAWQRYSQR